MVRSREKLEIVLAMMPELIAKEQKKLGLLNELYRSLAYEWAKEANVANIEIGFTYNKYLHLKRDYEKAVAANDTKFTFEGNVLLVAYAKYLLEYLDGKFARPAT